MWEPLGPRPPCHTAPQGRKATACPFAAPSWLAQQACRRGLTLCAPVVYKHIFSQRINDSLDFRDTSPHSRLFLTRTSPAYPWLSRGGAHAGSCRLSDSRAMLELWCCFLASRVGVPGSARSISYCFFFFFFNLLLDSFCLFSFQLQEKIKPG